MFVKKVDSSANAVTISAGASLTIDGASTYQLTTQYQRVMLQRQTDGNWYVLGT